MRVYPLDNSRPLPVGRLAMVLSYRGTRFHGWQSQSHCSPTIQACLEEALSAVADATTEVTAAGRTDAGVHATAQVIHFDTSASRDAQAWVKGTNHFLPEDIAIRWAGPVASDFHARFAAQARRYRYLIHNTPVRPALQRDALTWWFAPLDAQRMHQAAQYLRGEHDFSAFRDAQCQSRSVHRHLQQISVTRSGDLICVDVTANAYLHHMVRNIVGTLLEVGQGRQPISWVAEVLASADRTRAGITAPAAGLYFVAAIYPPDLALPSFPPGPDPFVIDSRPE